MSADASRRQRRFDKFVVRISEYGHRLRERGITMIGYARNDAPAYPSVRASQMEVTPFRVAFHTRLDMYHPTSIVVRRSKLSNSERETGISEIAGKNVRMVMLPLASHLHWDCLRAYLLFFYTRQWAVVVKEEIQ
jgi:hypothetical protein